MTNHTALYFHEGAYLGYEGLDPIAGQSSSRAFLCESCGKVYGYRIVTVLGKKNPYTTWGGLCKNCSPVGEEWNGSYSHAIPGGFPFFYQYKNPPEGVIKHQFEMELLTYDLRTNQTLTPVHPTRSQCLVNGTLWHRQDPLHRYIG